MLKSLSTAAILSLGVAGLALADEPQSGGTLVFTAPYGSSFATLDGHASPNIQEQFVTTAIHRSLYQWDSNTNAPRLELADSVDVSDDGTVYTYHLRENAVFHNGKSLTADDIIFSYERIASPENALPGARYIQIIKGGLDYTEGNADDIAGLKKIDDHTLEITLEHAINPAFALMEVTTAIMPSDVEPDEQAKSPIGIGPFVFNQHVPGSQATFTRFDDFYLEGKPYLDKLDVVIMGDAATRDVAFRNSEIDVSVLGPVQYQAYAQDSSLNENLVEVAEVFTRLIGFNLDNEVFQDVRVRQAINHAIDSELIIERLARGKAVRAVGYLPVSSPAYDDTAEPYAYDPDKAKELLEEAGVGDGISFEVTGTTSESYGTPIIEAVIPMLAKVGIDVKVKQVENAAMGGVLTSGDFQAFIFSNQTGPDPLEALRCFYSKTSRSACNYTHFNNPDFDELFEAAMRESDSDKQNDILREANNLIQEEAPVWFYNYNKAVMAHQPWVHGLVPNATELALQPYDDIWIDDSAPASRK